MAFKYVNLDTGSNGASGAVGAPWLTVAYGTTQLSAGDRLFVRGGASYAARKVCTETVTITTGTHNNGTSPSPITISNYPGEYVEFQNSTGLPFYIYQRDYWDITAVEADLDPAFDGSDYYIRLNANDKTSSGYCVRYRESNGGGLTYCRTDNGQYFCLIEFRDCDDWYVGYCKIFDNFIGPGDDAAGIQSQSNAVSNTGGIIEYCTIYDCGGDCYVADLPNGGDSADLHYGIIIRYNTLTAWSTAGKSENAIDLKVSADTLIHNNTISGFLWNDGTVSGTGANGADAIVVHSYSLDVTIHSNTFSAGSGSATRIQCSNSLIYRNVVRDYVDEAAVSSHLQSIFIWFSAGGGSQELYNNTVVGRHGADGNLLAMGANDDIIAKNNSFKDTGTYYTEVGYSITASYNGWYNAATSTSGSGDVTAAPLYYDESGNDFRPSSTSPLINAGTTISGVTDGHYGAAPDMGYFERGQEVDCAGAGLVASGTSGAVISPFTVTARQFDGATATAYTGTVTVSLSAGSGVLSGTLAVAASAGVATFSNVIITGTGSHTLAAVGT